jgi:biopolymer transport protein ExbD
MRMFFRRTGSSGETNGVPEINLTPLIDVCLVLVVILLLATPIGFESAIGMRRAAASARKAQLDSREERVEVHIVDDLRVEVNRVSVSRDSLNLILEPKIEASTLKRVVIDCEPGVSHGTFVNVLDRAKQSGAAEIAVVGS